MGCYGKLGREWTVDDITRWDVERIVVCPVLGGEWSIDNAVRPDVCEEESHGLPRHNRKPAGFHPDGELPPPSDRCGDPNCVSCSRMHDDKPEGCSEDPNCHDDGGRCGDPNCDCHTD